jgi:pyrroline-5-carboxylate reductase
MVGEGMTGLAIGPGVGQDEVTCVRRIFESVGKVVPVEERLMDAVTGLSGSGPAYIFLAIEAMADGGVKMGLPRDVASLLAAQTVLGAARMVLETGQHPARLKDQVASPGGTTIAGLHRLEQGGLRAVLIDAVEAATKRAQELGS